MRLHQLLQAFFEDVGVDLRGRNVRMSQEFLHDAKVCAIGQEMAGK